jgi:hypothetical protein
MGENKKFCDGIRDLINHRAHKFDTRFTRIQPDIDDALEKRNLKIIGCHIHLGSQKLASHAVTDLNQLKTELNEFVTRFEWQEAELTKTHGWLTLEHKVQTVVTDLVLRKWHGFVQPRRAYYGLVAAKDLATLYVREGKKLFEQNIRYYLGAEDVNTAITKTVAERPQDLFYLNNGLTAICTRVTPLPGHTQDEGTFHLEGFSIVNGAQTVGSIGAAAQAQGTVSADAKVLITLIEVGNSTPNPGTEITRTRNTQNAVRGLYFAALDPQQERLRTEMAVSGIIYHYRRSDETALAGNEITIGHAAIALAALSGNTRTHVAAKKESGQLYNRDGEYYPTLFRSRLSGITLCRNVRIYDYMDGIFAASERAEADWYRRMFYRHGRFFILHILARRAHHLLEKTETELSIPDQTELSRTTLELAELIYAAGEAMFTRQKGYLSVFRNIGDAEQLAQDVMKRLAALDALNKTAAQAAASTVTPAAPQPPPATHVRNP